MQPIRARTQATSVILVLIVLVGSVAAWSSLQLANYVEAVAAGGLADEEAGAALDDRQAVLGLLQTGLMLACAIAFSMWIHRAYRNLKLAHLARLRFTPGWAVGGFFVPFLNLVRPYQVMREISSGSQFLAGGEGDSKGDADGDAWQSVRPSPLLGWWWGLFLLMGVLGNASGRLMLMAKELEQVRVACWVTVASDLADIPAAVLALLLIRRIGDDQERTLVRHGAATRAATGTGSPPPLPRV